MNPRYAPMFAPYTLNNGVAIKNRFVVAPLTIYESDANGGLTDAARNFWRDRFRGFGLFVMPFTNVHPTGIGFPSPNAFDASHLPTLREYAAISHGQGAKIVAQIAHAGGRANPLMTRGLGAVAPSGYGRVREMSGAEVAQMVQHFARAAELALDAGLDGVEIHGANGWLIQQFVSAATNLRQDQWGGSRENRFRFPLAVIDAIDEMRRRKNRPDFIIGYRFSPEEAGEDGLTMTETGALIDALVQKPLQYLHVSLWEFDKKIRRGGDTAQTRMQFIHDRINGKLPLIGVGNLFAADDILAAFETGWAEFIALGKTVMINPHIATQISEGREAEIETQLDPMRADHYGLPDILWEFSASGTQSWLPPVKGTDWKPVDA